MPSLSNDPRLTSYLLGELPEPECAALEEEYFKDDSSFERLLAAEDELIDDYVQGALSPTERARLERRLRKSGQWRRRVRFAKALSQRLGSWPAPPGTAALERGRTGVGPFGRSWRGSRVLFASLAASLLVTAGGGWWLMAQIRQLRGEITRIRADQQALQREARELQTALITERSQREQLNKQIAEAQPEPKVSQKTAQFLLVAALRGRELGNQLRIAPDVDWVLLQIPAEERPLGSYRGALRTLGGKELLRSRLVISPPSSQGTRLSLRVPAHLLQPGGYLLLAEGKGTEGIWETVGEYRFQVVRK